MRNLKASMFDDPAKWPRCPFCKKRVSAQDINYWNVFVCHPCDIELTIGPGPISNGSKIVKDGEETHGR